LKPNNDGKKEEENVGEVKTVGSICQPSPQRQILPISRHPLRISHGDKPSSENKWGDDFEPESPPSVPRIGLSESSLPLPTKRHRNDDVQAENITDKTTREIPNTVIHQEINVPEGNLLNLSKPKSHSVNSSTSTLFHDRQNDITILLTTPEDEIPELSFSESSSLRSRSSSIASLPIMRLPRSPYNSLLMPPTDSQRDCRKQQHVEEIKAVRKWLITFINAKGDNLPRKVRQRMMDEYQICETDLDPEALARFYVEERDERITDRDNDELDQRESLQILSQAFQSQIKEVTLKRVNHPLLPITRKRANSRPVIPNLKSRLLTIPDDEELPPSWLGPLISTTMDSCDSVLDNPAYVAKSFSTPDLHAPTRPHCTTHVSAPVLGAKRELEPTRGKKSASLMGVFGTFVGSLGRRSSMIRPSKKSRVDHMIDSHG